MGCCACVLAWIAFAIVALGAALKIYIKLTTRRNGTYTTLVGKTAIITGANTGIGYTTALDFAMRGGRVILACRSREKAEDAQLKIIKATGNPNVVVKLVDFQSLDSVRQFAKDINETEKRLDILVNNAAAAFLGDKKTKDGLHVTMQVNHFAPFLLTHLLIGKLKTSAPSRIVNVSAEGAKHFASFDADRLNEHAEGGSIKAEVVQYSNSKLCNLVFTTELAKKLNGTGVSANALHPGLIKTDFARDAPDFVLRSTAIFKNLFFLTPEEGAQTTIYVALSKELEGVAGDLFDNCRRIEMYEGARDVTVAKKVWRMSEEYVKLRNEEKIPKTTIA